MVTCLSRQRRPYLLYLSAAPTPPLLGTDPVTKERMGLVPTPPVHYVVRLVIRSGTVPVIIMPRTTASAVVNQGTSLRNALKPAKVDIRYREGTGNNLDSVTTDNMIGTQDSMTDPTIEAIDGNTVVIDTMRRVVTER